MCLVYENIGTKYKLEYPSTILACLSVVVIVPIYVFYWKGEWFRNRSKFAQQLNLGRQQGVERRRSSAAALKGGNRDPEKQPQRSASDATAQQGGARHVEQV